MVIRMKKRIVMMAITGILCLSFLGCSQTGWEQEEDPFFLQEEEETGEKEIEEESLSSETKERQEEEKEPTIFAVHICGAVQNPGVYQVEEGTRMFQVLEMAGGFLDTADQEYLNLALQVEDGMQLRVPTMEETKEVNYLSLETSVQQSGAEGKIDLNKADETQLCTLPGIGESRARSIIQYRTEHGKFQRPEDIMKVSGIKEAAYEKIKDFIVVSK